MTVLPDGGLPDGGLPGGARPDRRFAGDAEAHRRDAPRFCPACGAALGIVTEFWEAAERRFYCWCPGCGWAGEITPSGGGVTGHEPA